jgi:hypothetical protein
VISCRSVASKTVAALTGTTEYDAFLEASGPGYVTGPHPGSTESARMGKGKGGGQAVIFNNSKQREGRCRCSQQGTCDQVGLNPDALSQSLGAASCHVAMSHDCWFKCPGFTTAAATAVQLFASWPRLTWLPGCHVCPCCCAGLLQLQSFRWPCGFCLVCSPCRACRLAGPLQYQLHCWYVECHSVRTMQQASR